jgi:hypothetical protein
MPWLRKKLRYAALLWAWVPFLLGNVNIILVMIIILLIKIVIPESQPHA